MIGLNKKFRCYGNINSLQKDDELLYLANEAGCNSWLIGFESMNQKTLGSIGKKTNRVEEYASAVRKIRDFGMMVTGLFMFGFDTDKPDVFELTLKSIKRLELDRASFAIVTPFPGTVLFNKLDKDGRIFSKDWSKYNLRNVVFKPKNMSINQLYNGRNLISRDFNSFSNCYRRGLKDKNISFFSLMDRIGGDYFLNRFYRPSN
jgi:radical SAM superfamily enzyme YgiQ (UPF0313 family)